jgi:hypothetical protein
MKITTNAPEIAQKLTIRSAATRARVVKVVHKHTLLLLAGVKANAHLPSEGPPGPRYITGDYNRSWNVRFSGNGSVSRGTVGTNKEQARRLEYGFTGTDSLGRHYAQPPYVHVLPAVEAQKDPYLTELREELKKP